jgi:hypothetical protein
MSLIFGVSAGVGVLLFCRGTTRRQISNAINQPEFLMKSGVKSEQKRVFLVDSHKTLVSREKTVELARQRRTSCQRGPPSCRVVRVPREPSPRRLITHSRTEPATPTSSEITVQICKQNRRKNGKKSGFGVEIRGSGCGACALGVDPAGVAPVPVTAVSLCPFITVFLGVCVGVSVSNVACLVAANPVSRVALPAPGVEEDANRRRLRHVESRCAPFYVFSVS